MVAVCVAPTDLRPEVDDLTGEVRADARRSDLTASDAAAVEYGLRLAEATGARVLVVAVGPPEVDAVLRPLLALGAEVVRIGSGPHPPTGPPGPAPLPAAELAGDPAAVAAALAAAIRRRGQPLAVLCGDRSGGQGVGAVPALLAHDLGIDQALGLVSISIAIPEPATGDGPPVLMVERRLDGGWRERLAVTGPAVLSVEAAGTRLRTASLAAALAAEAAPVPAEAPAAPPGGAPPAGGGASAPLRVGKPRPYRPRPVAVAAPKGDARARLLALTGALSDREPARVVGPLDPAVAVDELLAYLQRNGYTR